MKLVTRWFLGVATETKKLNPEDRTVLCSVLKTFPPHQRRAMYQYISGTKAPTTQRILRNATAFPTVAGEELADEFLQAEPEPGQELSLDLRGAPPAMLVACFYAAFLQKIYEVAPEKLQKMRRLEIKTDHPHQHAKALKAFKEFQPVGKTAT